MTHFTEFWENVIVLIIYIIIINIVCFSSPISIFINMMTHSNIKILPMIITNWTELMCERSSVPQGDGVVWRPRRCMTWASPLSPLLLLFHPRPWLCGVHRPLVVGPHCCTRSEVRRKETLHLAHQFWAVRQRGESREKEGDRSTGDRVIWGWDQPVVLVQRAAGLYRGRLCFETPWVGGDQ